MNMRLSLIDRFSSLIVILFFSIIIFVISIKSIRIITENKIFIYLTLFVFFRVLPLSWFITRVFLFKLRLIICSSIWICDWKMDLSSVGWLLIHHSLPLFIFFDILWFCTLIVYIWYLLLSKPKGKWAFRSSLTNYLRLFKAFIDQLY